MQLGWRPLVSFLVVASLGLGCGDVPPTDETDLATDDAGAASDGGRPEIQATSAVSVIVMPGPGMKPVVDAIRAAKTSVDLTVYFLSDSGVVDALIAARGANKQVRVILEENPDSLSNFQVFQRLGQAAVPVRYGNPAFQFTHSKTIVIDGQTLWAMTMNLATSAPGNREYLLVDTDPADVAEANAIFEADWNRTNAPTPSRLVVSPESSRKRLNELIRAAREIIEVEWEALSDNNLGLELTNRLRAGVTVRIIVPDDLNGNATEALMRQMKAGGAEVRTLSAPQMHAKMILVDHVVGYIGSINGTSTSLDRNREIGVIWDQPTVVKTVSDTFAIDYAAARPF